MYYSAIRDYDVANGPGVRVSLFVSGCSHKCEGCFQPETWNPKYGDLFLDKDLDHIIQSLKPDYIDGITILGGDPLEIKNIHQVKYIIRECKRYYELTHDKPLNIWLWTGSIFENLCLLFAEDWEDPHSIGYVDDLKYIFNNIDVLIDGPFIEEKKDLNLAFRGSSNQRLIDMRKTFENKKVTLLDIKENMRHG